MSVTVTVNPTAPDAAKDFCAVTVAGADQNDDTAYNANNYPASPEMRYYLTFESPDGTEQGRSYIFGVDETGGHLFMNYVFPEAGTWVVHLRDESDDSSVADSGNVTVS